MAKVAFLVLFAIVAYASADYPLPYSFYTPPPPKPHSIYGVPNIHSGIFVKPEPYIPQKPATVYGVPEFDKVADLSYIVPGIQHHEIIPHKFPPKPVQSHYKYELPEHTAYIPPKFEIPVKHYPQPAPVYGLPKIF